MPPDATSILKYFTNAVATLSNPSSPFLIANLIFDFFTLLVFYKYTHIWIWLFALGLWLITLIVLICFAIFKPHMLSSTNVQKFGMQLSAGIGQKGSEEISQEDYEKLPLVSATPLPEKPELNAGKLAQGKKNE